MKTPEDKDVLGVRALATQHSHVVVTDSPNAPGFMVTKEAVLSDFDNVVDFGPPFRFFYRADVDNSGRITHHVRHFGELRLGTIFVATGGH